jgi:hypothetical protein
MRRKGPDDISKAVPESPSPQTKIRITEDADATGDTAAAYDYWRAGSAHRAY